MFKVIIELFNKTHEIEIGNEPDCFNQTTIAELKQKISISNERKNIFNDARLKFNNLILNDSATLAFYGIKNGSELSLEKYFDPEKKFGLKFAVARDSITDEDNGLLKAVLSCGHAVDPNSLTAWCRSLIDSGKLEFHCPAIIKPETNEKCGKKWAYDEIKKIALLNEIEMEFFELKLSENAAKTYIDYKECPKCKSFIVREDLANLRVDCSLCPVFLDREFEFCWQCEQEWTEDLDDSSETCGRVNCVNPILQVLRDCRYMRLSECYGGLPDVPSIRACPTCGNRIEHTGQACKNVLCPRCSVQFCFACLETTAACQRASPGSHFGACAKPVAPKQTKIPIWNRNLRN